MRIVDVLCYFKKTRESEDHLVAWDKNCVLSEDYIILHSESSIHSSEIKWWVFYLKRFKIFKF